VYLNVLVVLGAIQTNMFILFMTMRAANQARKEGRRVDPKRLFAANPPSEPLDSLSAIVRDWNKRFIEGDAKRFRDEVVEYCRDADNFVEAVERAVASRRPNGKMHNHQSKVKEVDRRRFGYAIVDAIDPEKDLSFDDLYDRLREIRPKGIGPVTTYDVATRIGAFLDIEPEQLYLHAGVLEGWKVLHGGRVPVAIRLPREMWPKPLRQLPADQVEDLLCCYRALLPEVSLD
jgi:hypothetical protein